MRVATSSPIVACVLFEGYGPAVHRLRKERGLSQGTIAKAAGINVMTLRRIEKQQGDTSLKTLSSVMEALGVRDLVKFVSVLQRGHGLRVVSMGDETSERVADAVRQTVAALPEEDQRQRAADAFLRILESLASASGILTRPDKT